MITDRVPAYASLVPGAEHVWCRAQHQPGVPHWLKPPCTTEAESNARQPVMKRLFHTHDKRTVRRRLAPLRERAPELGMTPWLNRVEEKLPALLCSVGSSRLPSTTNAMERFFRALERFYKTRQGFHSVLSAKRELLRFRRGAVCSRNRRRRATRPSKSIVPEARCMPLYRLIKDPFRALQERAAVKSEATMADLLRPKAAEA